jgi:putative ABC transport system permease protein
VGDTTTVLVLGPPQRVRISGIARFGKADSPGGATTVIFNQVTAQRLVAEPGKYDGIELVARGGISQTELARRVSAVLPAGVEAVTGKAVTAENQSAIRKALSFFNTFLLIFAVIALLVGGFMMFNTFAITVAQRTRENGLLRALGASRRQILSSVLRPSRSGCSRRWSASRGASPSPSGSRACWPRWVSRSRPAAWSSGRPPRSSP